MRMNFNEANQWKQAHIAEEETVLANVKKVPIYGEKHSKLLRSLYEKRRVNFDSLLITLMFSYDIIEFPHNVLSVHTTENVEKVAAIYADKCIDKVQESTIKQVTTDASTKQVTTDASTKQVTTAVNPSSAWIKVRPKTSPVSVSRSSSYDSIVDSYGDSGHWVTIRGNHVFIRD